MNVEATLKGTWINEYGSVMDINEAKEGIFSGRYSSTTGDTGIYTVVGVYDAKPSEPTAEEITVAFSISWRSISGDDDDSSFGHGSSGFSGQIQPNGADHIMPVIHALTLPHRVDDTWQNTLIDKLTFVKQDA